jgi:hypothetical protein
MPSSACSILKLLKGGLCGYSLGSIFGAAVTTLSFMIAANIKNASFSLTDDIYIETLEACLIITGLTGFFIGVIYSSPCSDEEEQAEQVAHDIQNLHSHLQLGTPLQPLDVDAWETVLSVRPNHL